ncbi:MAG: bifunctional DNA primase/polymerase, partial [SAR324 cluster bacterium]|nr:bifunctional DNA primase/polymerase [SAR324 cluster bacterium]
MDTESLLNLFSAEDNVGLLCGVQRADGKYLVGIDYDNEALWRQHLKQASDNEGFNWLMGGPVVETGSGKRHHYVLSDSAEKIVFADASGKHHAGEVQGAGTQLVAPPSIHPTTVREYRWLDESWQDIQFVDHLTLAASYPAKAGKQKFNRHSKKKEKQGFSNGDAGNFGNDSTFYDYSTIDFIALFQSRGWVIEDKG